MLKQFKLFNQNMFRTEIWNLTFERCFLEKQAKSRTKFIFCTYHSKNNAVFFTTSLLLLNLRRVLIPTMFGVYIYIHGSLSFQIFSRSEHLSFLAILHVCTVALNKLDST